MARNALDIRRLSIRNDWQLQMPPVSDQHHGIGPKEAFAARAIHHGGVPPKPEAKRAKSSG